MTTHKLYLHESYLSDGSLVYSVILPHESLPAVTLADAISLIEKVEQAIADHTNETTKRVELSERLRYGAFPAAVS